MRDFFIEGGFGMLLTAPLGLCLIAAVLHSAFVARSRAAELILPLGVATIASGFFGFVTGMMATFNHIAEVEGNAIIAVKGTSESMNNLALAFGLVLFAAVTATVGRALKPRAVPQTA